MQRLIIKLNLNKIDPEQILVGRPEYAWEDGRPVMTDTESPEYGKTKDIGQQLAMQFEQLQHIVFARMVQKVGDRRYWEQWAKNVAEIAGDKLNILTDWYEEKIKP